MLLLIACTAQEQHFSGKTMGTTYQIKFTATQKTPPLAQIKAQVERKLQQINQVFSTYIPNSEVSQINRAKDVKLTFSLGPLMQKALRLSLQVYQLSEGFFDPSVGPLVNLWGHGPKRHQNPPSTGQIKRALALVGLDKYFFSQDFKQLRKPHPEAYLDFSASAKGLGVDEVAQALESMGIQEYMIEIGGEIRVRSQGEKRWNLAIEHPRPEHQRPPIAVVAIDNGALATSGNYRNYYTVEGVRYGHTINPHNGQASPNDLVSVSVIHRNCTLADAWATALLAMGSHKALDKANRLGLKALLIASTSTGLAQLQSNDWPLSAEVRP